MALGATTIANATTLTFGTGLTGVEILDFDWNGMEKASIDTSHLGTSGGKTFIFSNQYNPGTLDITCHMDDSTLNEKGADLANAQTTVSALTLTFPQTGATSAGSLGTANAALVNMTTAGSVDDKITHTLSFKLTGDVTFTDGV